MHIPHNKKIACVLAISTLLLNGCKKEQPAEQPVNVLVTAVGNAAISNMNNSSSFVNAPVSNNASANGRQFSAVIGSKQESTLAFKVAGRVQSKFVEMGSTVKAGQVLYKLEANDYTQGDAAAKSQYDAASIDAKQQQLEAERLSRLVEDGSVARADYERQVAKANAAAATRDAYKNQLQLASNKVTDTLIKAPFDGIVVRTLAESGQVVAAGQPIIAIAKNNALEAVVNVPEQMAFNLAQKKAYIQNAQSTATSPLTLRLVAQAAHPVAKTFEARYIGVPAGFKLGMTANVFIEDNTPLWQNNQRISSANDNAATVQLPASSLVKRQGSAFVWLVNKNNQLVSQAVTISKYDNQNIWVTGVPNNSLVVSVGAYKLSATSKVKPVLRNSAQ